jgi:CRISPR system Cascade subunit CasD
MGRPVLLLRLEGVWQSWGERSRWDVRDTGTEPTKSGIVGLLGCALGYPMRDPRLEAELDAGLRFGVRVESPGRVVQDYQTITGFLPTAEGTYRHSGVSTAKSLEKLVNDPDVTPATIVSPRYYLEDASFLVVLEEREGFNGLLERCRAALERPKWPVFLGRKACVPTRPVLEELSDRYDGMEDALTSHPWSWLRSNMEERENTMPEALVVMIEAPDGGMVRHDAVRTNQARQYGFRRVRRYTVPAPKEGRS